MNRPAHRGAALHRKTYPFHESQNKPRLACVASVGRGPPACIVRPRANRANKSGRQDFPTAAALSTALRSNSHGRFAFSFWIERLRPVDKPGAGNSAIPHFVNGGELNLAGAFGEG